MTPFRMSSFRMSSFRMYLFINILSVFSLYYYHTFLELFKCFRFHSPISIMSMFNMIDKDRLRLRPASVKKTRQSDHSFLVRGTEIWNHYVGQV